MNQFVEIISYMFSQENHEDEIHCCKNHVFLMISDSVHADGSEDRGGENTDTD